MRARVASGEWRVASGEEGFRAVTLRRQVPNRRRAWNAREILTALMEGADVRGFNPDGSVTLSWTVPADLMDELCAWDDAREDEQLDEAEPLLRYGGNGAA